MLNVYDSSGRRKVQYFPELVLWEASPVTAGGVSNRTTGGSFGRQTFVFTTFQCLAITVVKWDLNLSGTYSLYLTTKGADVSVSSVVASQVVGAGGVFDFVPDDEYLSLDVGQYYLTLKRTSGNGAWKDNTADTRLCELFYEQGIYYDGTYYSTYTAPVQLTAYKGKLQLPFP